MTDHTSVILPEANVIWFRHGLRLHDNPALLAALQSETVAVGESSEKPLLIAIFIFDGESAGTKYVGYNRLHFLLESLRDLDEQLHAVGGSLLLCRGDPCELLERLQQYVRLRRVCCEQDCEPIWLKRDNAVRQWCQQQGVDWVEKVSHTLWNPRTVIKTNGGIPPLTYQMFLHTVQIIGPPPRPVADPDWTGVRFVEPTSSLRANLKAFEHYPTPEDFGVYRESRDDGSILMPLVIWKGGERQALEFLAERLRVEEKAFRRGQYLPNQANPNILDAPKSMSAHLRFGCLSVRRFYWSVHDLFQRVQLQAIGTHRLAAPGGEHITGQLVWREYFYTMSVNNPRYDRMEGNNICLRIPWAPACSAQLKRWKDGTTGFPLVDASMRQLMADGWLHHTLRNTVATFLTRGGLWQNWEHGLRHFLRYLLDADWSVCAGNWLWVSSSAFERLLDSSLVTCPVALAKRLDPQGQYIKRYVPELANVPREYVHEPWRMPPDVQHAAGCVLGVNYPERMIDLSLAGRRNALAMQALRSALIAAGEGAAEPPHCRPSNDQEIQQFFWLAE